MAGLSLATQKAIGDHILGIATYALPAGLFMSLHTADPTDSGSTTDEVSTIATGYARFDLAGKMSAVELSSGLSNLTATVNIGPALIDWGLITHAGFWDAATAGTMLFSGELSTAQDMTAGKQFQLLAGQMAVQLL